MFFLFLPVNLPLGKEEPIMRPAFPPMASAPLANGTEFNLVFSLRKGGKQIVMDVFIQLYPGLFFFFSGYIF